MNTTTQTVTPALRQWIADQVRGGFTPEQVLKSMLDSGWHFGVASQALQDVTSDIRQEMERSLAGQAFTKLPEPSLEDSPSRIVVDGHPVDIVMTSQDPRVVVFGNLLTHAECDGVVDLAAKRLERSHTVDNRTGGSEVNSARTSEGMFFDRGENELVLGIEKRIAALLNWPLENGEGLQVLRYRPGAEYKPHYDYFDPTQPGTPAILSRGGQRVATLVMYLNTPDRGGATTFPDVKLEVAPVKGNAVFFSYDRPHPATKTLHGGAPVIAGEKWVATKWLRIGRFA
ncbi:MAG TPA: 2OG-Fe(II) oxygenase [Burkholderiaceae bacterium]|jgi:prolyl 4-hydroxylase|nr:2OG-Fe(II) oxygenase [Burkholderiaceae bacterium]